MSIRDEEDTGHVSLPEDIQVFLRPDNKLGASRAHSMLVFCLITENGKCRIEKVTRTISCALHHMSTEIMMNTCDNKTRSTEEGVDPGEIEINVDSQYVEVINGGSPMPVKIMKSFDGYDVWLPSEMFERCTSGSNYDDSKTRKLAGKNGVGAGAVLALSEWGELEVIDTQRKRHFIQQWSKPDYDASLCGDSMSVATIRKIGRRFTKGPTVTDHHDANSGNMVRFKFKPVFARFHVEKYDEGWIEVLHADAHFLAFCAEIPVYFNGQLIDYSKSCKKFYSLLGADSYKEVLVGSFNYKVKGEPEIIGDWRITFLPNTLNIGVLSFVNGTPTHGGGKHITALYNAIVGILSEKYKDKIYPDEADEEQDVKGRKAISKNEKQRRDLIKKVVEKNLNCTLRLTISKPEFEGQQKDKLDTNPGVPEFTEDDLDFLDLDEDILYAHKAEMLLAASDLVKKRRANSRSKPKDLIDCNNLINGKRHPDNCLNITEGKSSMKYPDQGLADRVHNGFLPIRGKSPNVTHMEIDRVAKSMVIASIMDAIGLNFGEDYTIPSVNAKRRYQKIRICADADNDGFHIQALLVNLFAIYWPSLFKIGAITILESPKYRAIKNGKQLAFYTDGEFYEWFDENNEGKGWNITYCKGLGQHNPADIAYDFRNGVVETTVRWDDNAIETLEKAFSTKQSNTRKNIILDSTLPAELPLIGKITITDLITTRWRQFSISNIVRGIASFPDGLKEGERKILYMMLKKYLGKNISNEKDTSVIGVNALAGAILENANYHHGETSLYGTESRMTRGFPGTSNLPLFYPAGNHGSRDENGADHAAARYIKVCPRAYLRHIFRPEDDAILPYTIQEDTGTYAEPDFYLPIIPIALTDNRRGMGSGWSMTIPPYDPLEIINELKNILDGYSPNYITPTYRFYNGKIIIYRKGRDDDVETIEQAVEQDINDDNFDDELEVREEEISTVISTTSAPHIEIKGDYDVEIINGCYNVTIRDSPPGYSLNRIYKHYSDLQEQGVITYLWRGEGSFRFDCTLILSKETTKAIDKEENSEKVLEDLLWLRDTVSMNNMYLLDPKTKLPKKYKDVTDILVQFVKFRLGWYKKRKKYMIGKLQSSLYGAKEQIKLINMLRDKSFSLYYDDGKAKSNPVIVKDLKAVGLDYSAVSLDTTKHSDLHFASLEKMIKTVNAEISTIEATSEEDMMRSDLDELNNFLVTYYSKLTIDETIDEELKKQKKRKNTKNDKK